MYTTKRIPSDLYSTRPRVRSRSRPASPHQPLAKSLEPEGALTREPPHAIGNGGGGGSSSGGGSNHNSNPTLTTKLTFRGRKFEPIGSHQTIRVQPVTYQPKRRLSAHSANGFTKEVPKPTLQRATSRDEPTPKRQVVPKPTPFTSPATAARMAAYGKDHKPSVITNPKPLAFSNESISMNLQPEKINLPPMLSLASSPISEDKKQHESNPSRELIQRIYDTMNVALTQYAQQIQHVQSDMNAIKQHLALSSPDEKKQQQQQPNGSEDHKDNSIVSRMEKMQTETMQAFQTHMAQLTQLIQQSLSQTKSEWNEWTKQEVESRNLFAQSVTSMIDGLSARLNSVNTNVEKSLNHLVEDPAIQ